MKKQPFVQSQQLPLSISAIAATSLSASAATLVQIDFSGNTISSNNGNQLFADMDFDGNVDLTFTNPRFNSNSFYSTFGTSSGMPTSGTNYIYRTANVRINGDFANAYNKINSGSTSATVGAVFDNPTARNWISAQLNSSALGTHQGFIEVVANAGDPASIQILRFVYDQDATTTNRVDLDLNRNETSIGVTSASGSTLAAVPEPSSLGLLALGAAGVMIRRRRKSA